MGRARQLANSANKVTLTAWTIVEEAGILYLAHNGVRRFKIESNGTLTVVGDVSAFGTV